MEYSKSNIVSFIFHLISSISYGNTTDIYLYIIYKYNYMGNSSVTRVTFCNFMTLKLNILFTILLFSNQCCVCCYTLGYWHRQNII